jgi:hypothetical protein
MTGRPGNSHLHQEICLVKISVSVLCAAAVAVCCWTQPASAAFIVPDGATAPFADWSRSDANSAYAEWNTFTVAAGAPGNSPDVGSFGPTTANLTQSFFPALITSGGNIYSFAGATDFDVTLPNYGYGAGYSTRVVAQIGTLGTPLLQGSLSLTYSDGNATQQAALTSATVAVAPNPLGGTTDEWLVVWDVPSYNPSSFLLKFVASGSSMSLDRLAVDAFTQAVPEPATFAIAGISLAGCVAVARRRSRPTPQVG